MLALTYGDKTFLFESDAENEAEEAMTLNSSVQVPDADVLKVAHHGSSSSTTKTFLELVSPEIAVISVGAGNSYGHPTEATLDRLETEGAEIYRTDENGAVTITTDGTALTVKTEKESAAPGASDHAHSSRISLTRHHRLRYEDRREEPQGRVQLAPQVEDTRCIDGSKGKGIRAVRELSSADVTEED